MLGFCIEIWLLVEFEKLVVFFVCFFVVNNENEVVVMVKFEKICVWLCNIILIFVFVDIW